MDESNYETRQECRERKLQKKRDHMQKHGASMGKVYRDAIEKRIQTRAAKSKGFRIK